MRQMFTALPLWFSIIHILVSQTSHSLGAVHRMCSIAGEAHLRDYLQAEAIRTSWICEVIRTWQDPPGGYLPRRRVLL